MEASSRPNPALVTVRGARRLPRLALLLLCAAYLLPGIFDRDPWRNADLIAYGQMHAIAEGRTSWLAPALGGVPADAAPLPHWLGAAFIWLLSPAVDADNAARIPFVLLLAGTLALVWYTTFHLARTEAAQPLAFAFGGEADPVDYARAMADGAVLALIATLGLLQLGHETTPELAQLASVALFLWAIAAAPFRRWRSRAAMAASLACLAGSGAPTMALAVGAFGTLICVRSRYPELRRQVPWMAAALAAAVAAAWGLDTWRLRVEGPTVAGIVGLLRQWLWFLWPAWLLALWTLWRWRWQLLSRHIALPVTTVLVAVAASAAMRGADRPLLLALPGLAVLAAFALPTLKRSTSAAIDWFSMFFFSAAALGIWVVYLSLHTGVPLKPGQNVMRLLPGFAPHFELDGLVLATVGSLAWVWLVRWRTGRHREALWKSMVLPAGGVALNWLLLMTLWLPELDYARSSRQQVERLSVYVPRGSCVAAPGLSPVHVAALEVFGDFRVDARPAADREPCTVMVRAERPQAPRPRPDGAWEPVARVPGLRSRDEAMVVYRRQAATESPTR